MREGAGSVGSGRAEATGAPIDGGQGLFFNLGAFKIPVPGTFGDAGRNTIEGLGLFSINVSLSRSLHAGKRTASNRGSRGHYQSHPSSRGHFHQYGSERLNYSLPLTMRAMRTLSATVRFRF